MRIAKNQIFASDVPVSVSLVPEELRNPGILHMNRLSPRATVVPAQKTGVYYRCKEESDRILSLNGDYRFALFSDFAPEDFEKENFDDADWDTLDVPSMWQFRGYAEPTYPNVEYPFPFSPPYILRLNPVGCYRRTFTVPEDQTRARAILHFEGVDNAFYVYLNGTFVGFSKGSRLPAEFDVTSLLRTGENTLAVKVYTYSDASYLENQDMLLASGIFRDVYLIFSPACGLWDWSIITDTEKCKVTLTPADASAISTAELTFNGRKAELTFENGKSEYVFKRENEELWNAEQPNLYDLTLCLTGKDGAKEIHSKRVGFVTSAVVPRAFSVNGAPVLLKGVNRHENDPDNGRAMTVKQIERDLKLIKSHNINAIRCSHYPNNPAFYELCGEMGIYVMDEGDLESHGCGITGDQGFLNKTPAWKDAFLDRVIRMAERDKNETCIVLWSVGNEIGTGENCEACAEYLRGREDKKPVLYHSPNPADTAFIGHGYCNIHGMNRVTEKSKDDPRPICLIEYAHAMGNSPGNLVRLWDYVLDHPAYTGGYVWEFRSHGMRRRNSDGTVDYLYGGDFHDDNHWSNFTLDGYCRSDGTPKPTFEELKYVYAPVVFRYEKGELLVRSTLDFTDTAAYRFEYEVLADGKSETHALDVPVLPPRGRVTLKLAPDYQGYDCYLTLRAYKRGDLVAQRQFPLEKTCENAPVAVTGDAPTAVTQGDRVSVKGKNFRVEFAGGVPVYYEKDGVTYFDRPMRFTTYRAETDNDGIVSLYPRWIGKWEEQRLQKMQFFMLNVKAETTDKTVVKAEGMLTADHCFAGFNVSAEYTVLADGTLLTDLHVSPFGRMPNCQVYGSASADEVLTSRLPRFGVCFALSKDRDKCAWRGRGADQSYTDSYLAAPVGTYERPISELNFEFDVPQETGNHEKARYVQLKNGRNAFVAYGSDELAFSYHPWKLDDLRKARHTGELKEDKDCNYLYLDYRMRALGSFSCGPNPETEDDFEPHTFRFVFAVNGETGERPVHENRSFGVKTEKLSGLYVRPEIETEREVIECRSVKE